MAGSVSGSCDARFARVREAFADNLASGGEVGAAVCVYAAGQPVVDLWGGLADPETGRPWGRDTIVSTFSVSKGVVSTMAHMLIDRGALDPDAPVARYWYKDGSRPVGRPSPLLSCRSTTAPP